MINLLTDEYKKKIKAEYRKRIFSAMFLLLFFLFLIATVLLIPSYIISKEKYLSVNKEASSITIENKDEVKEIGKTIKLVNEKISILRIGSTTPQTNQLISLVISKKSTPISINSISYEARGNTAKLDISGVARDRDSLLLFVDTLKKQKEFSEVFFPVSNLVRESDIDFNIQLAIVR